VKYIEVAMGEGNRRRRAFGELSNTDMHRVHISIKQYGARAQRSLWKKETQFRGIEATYEIIQRMIRINRLNVPVWVLVEHRRGEMNE